MEALLASIVIGVFFAVMGSLFLYPAVGHFRNFRAFRTAGRKTIDEISYDSGETAIVSGEMVVRDPVQLPVEATDSAPDVGAYAWELHGRSESGSRRRQSQRTGRRTNKRQVDDYGLEYGDVVIDTGTEEVAVDFEFLKRRHDRDAASPGSHSGWGPSKASPFGSSTIVLDGHSVRQSLTDLTEVPERLTAFLESRSGADTDSTSKRFEIRYVREDDTVTAYGAADVRQGVPLITESDDGRLVFSDQPAKTLPRSSLKRFLQFFGVAVLLFCAAGALFSLLFLGLV